MLHGTTNTSTPYSLRGSLLGPISAKQVVLRNRYDLGPLYLGWEIGIGLAGIPAVTDPLGGASTSGDAAQAISGGGLAGLLIPRVGPVSGHLETFFGGRETIVLLATPPPDACVDGDGEGCFGHVGEGVIEARAGLDVWLNPWLTIGGWAGINALHPDERSIGVALAWHSIGHDQR